MNEQIYEKISCYESSPNIIVRFMQLLKHENKYVRSMSIQCISHLAYSEKIDISEKIMSFGILDAVW